MASEVLNKLDPLEDNQMEGGGTSSSNQVISMENLKQYKDYKFNQKTKQTGDKCKLKTKKYLKKHKNTDHRPSRWVVLKILIFIVSSKYLMEEDPKTEDLKQKKIRKHYKTIHCNQCDKKFDLGDEELCEICGKAFQNFIKLKKHKQVTHTLSNFKIFNKHVMKHGGDKFDIKCEQLTVEKEVGKQVDAE